MSDQLNLLLEFKRLYTNFNTESLQQLPMVYAENSVFEDPVHRVEGLDALQRYFGALVNDLVTCCFIFESESSPSPSILRPGEQEMYFVWRMEFCHRRLGNGKLVSVRGVTRICFDNKVTFHEDFYDMGVMLYEHVPALGWMVKKLKQRLAVSAQ